MRMLPKQRRKYDLPPGRHIYFVNDCGCIVDYDLLEKAYLFVTGKKFRYEDTVLKRKIMMRGKERRKYPTLSVGYIDMHISRILISYHLGKDLQREEHVHHKNGNVMNNTIENLELLSKKEHRELHKTFNNGHDGAYKALTKEQEEQILELLKKNKTLNEIVKETGLGGVIPKTYQRNTYFGRSLESTFSDTR